MRDFFHDNARDREFDDKKAEIIHAISDNIDSNQEMNLTKQDKILHQLSSITKQLTDVQKEVRAIKYGNRDKIKRIPSKVPNVGAVKSIIGSFASDGRNTSLPSDRGQPQRQQNVNTDVGQVGDIKSMDQRLFSTQL